MYMYKKKGNSHIYREPDHWSCHGFVISTYK